MKARESFCSSKDMATRFRESEICIDDFCRIIPTHHRSMVYAMQESLLWAKKSLGAFTTDIGKI